MKTFKWLWEQLKWILTIPAAKQILLGLLVIIFIQGWLIFALSKKLDIAADKNELLRDRVETATARCEEEKGIIKEANNEMLMSVVSALIQHEALRAKQMDSVISEGRALLKYSNSKIKKLNIR